MNKIIRFAHTRKHLLLSLQRKKDFHISMLTSPSLLMLKNMGCCGNIIKEFVIKKVL